LLSRIVSDLFSAFKRSPLQFRDKPATKNAPLDRQLRRILQPIFEEAPSPRNRSRVSARDPFFDLQEERDQDRDDYDEYNERHGPVFPWEDEKTLVSDLMNGYEGTHVYASFDCLSVS